jgi:hypothetical protein
MIFHEGYRPGQSAQMIWGRTEHNALVVYLSEGEKNGFAHQ